jgi:hypothetical protein
MNASFELDHLVVVVKDLEKARSIFRDKGFYVSQGGTHGLTINALILFEEGPYIELIAMKSNFLRKIFKILHFFRILKAIEFLAPSLIHRFINWFTQSNGIRDICFSGSNFKNNTLPHSKSKETLLPKKRFYRETLSGKKAEWYLTGYQMHSLPFFIEDITNKEIRFPIDNSDTNKINTGFISKVLVNVKELALFNDSIIEYKPHQDDRFKIQLSGNNTLNLEKTLKNL